LRYYYGIKQADGTVLSASHIKKGTTKTQYKNLRRMPFYTEITISGYLWNVTKSKWVKKQDLKGLKYFSWYSDFKGNSPKSAKAFNRYVQKLLKEYDFKKGTIIQLSGRFDGIGIFCIVGGK